MNGYGRASIGNRNGGELGTSHGAEGSTSSGDSRASRFEVREWKEHGVLPEATKNNRRAQLNELTLETWRCLDFGICVWPSFLGLEVVHVFWESPKCVGGKNEKADSGS